MKSKTKYKKIYVLINDSINSTFEELIHGLKRTILDVQGRMDKNSKNLSEMQKKLEEKDEEILVLRQFEADVTSAVNFFVNSIPKTSLS